MFEIMLTSTMLTINSHTSHRTISPTDSPTEPPTITSAPSEVGFLPIPPPTRKPTRKPTPAPTDLPPIFSKSGKSKSSKSKSGKTTSAKTTKVFKSKSEKSGKSKSGATLFAKSSKNHYVSWDGQRLYNLNDGTEYSPVESMEETDTAITSGGLSSLGKAGFASATAAVIVFVGTFLLF